MASTHVAAVNRRMLCTVYRFFDAFMTPVNALTPPVAHALRVSIPSLAWTALRVAEDGTYRFSASTLTMPAPAGPALPVTVLDESGAYVNHVPLVLTLPRPVSSPPVAADFLIDLPLWPTPAWRPPPGETAIRGHVTSPTAQAVDHLQVEMWTGPSLVPPAGTPFTFTDVHGGFLFRFPFLKAAPAQPLPLRIRLQAGLLPVVPATLSATTGQTQVIPFQRT
jgi:hypothetical protein